MINSTKNKESINCIGKRIFIAASYENQGLIRIIANSLIESGFYIANSWIHEESGPTIKPNFSDIINSDFVLCLYPMSSSNQAEMAYAYALNKTIIYYKQRSERLTIALDSDNLIADMFNTYNAIYVYDISELNNILNYIKTYGIESLSILCNDLPEHNMFSSSLSYYHLPVFSFIINPDKLQKFEEKDFPTNGIYYALPSCCSGEDTAKMIRMSVINAYGRKIPIGKAFREIFIPEDFRLTEAENMILRSKGINTFDIIHNPLGNDSDFYFPNTQFLLNKGKIETMVDNKGNFNSWFSTYVEL